MTVHQFGTFDAKNKLSHLLDLVEQGDEVIITRNGKPVARMVAEKSDVESAVDAMHQIEEISRRSKPLGDLSIKDLVNEGRRF